MIIKMVKFFLKKLNNVLVGNFRTKILSEIIVNIILKYSNNKQIIKIVDYGSGYQPKVIFCIYEILKNKYKLNVKVDCYDIYDALHLKTLNKNSDILFFPIKNLSLNDTKYDFCLINDVLHHIGINKVSELKNLINDLQNRATYILIKDHFQYGFFSNLTLRLMDFFGNYFNDVKIPTKYFQNIWNT